MLQYILKSVFDFFQKPSTQRAIKDALIRAAHAALANPNVRREIGKSAEKAGESVVDFFSRINIKITHRQNEIRVIIDASAKITCSANNVSNATVVQGQNIIVNNIQVLLFTHSKDDINELKEKLQKLNNLQGKCINEKNSSIEIKNFINLEYTKLDKELFSKLSKMTDYAMLQKALGTED